METLIRNANRGSVSTGPYEIENSCRFDNWYNYTQVNPDDDTGDDWMHRDEASGDISTRDSNDGQKWCMSFWLKRGGRWIGNPIQNKGSYGHQSEADRNRQGIIGGWNSARYSWMGFDSVSGNEDAFYFSMKATGNSHTFITNAQYRDHAAWYHFFLKVDSTQNTSTDRLQLWVNGVRVTSWDSYGTIAQNATHCHFWADSVRHNIGRYHYSSGEIPFHGYLADFYFLHNDTVDSIDTADYVATTFGEFNDDGIWVPIKANVAYGDQAYFLNFQDAADLGKDASGKGNDFTSYSLSAVNQCTDTPTNNFCVMQPAQNAANGAQPRTLWGGLRVTEGGTSSQSSHATMGVTTGKWYYEHYMEDDFNTPQNHGAGWIGTKQDMTGNGNGWTRLTTRIHYGDGISRVANGWGASGTGAANNNNTGAYYSGSEGPADEDDVMGTAVDLDAGKMWFHINGIWHYASAGNQGNPATGANPRFTNIATVLDGTQHLVPAQSQYTSGPPIRLLNFGNPPTAIFTAIGTHSDDNGYGSFAYEPPSGFLALCSKNVGESGLSNIVDDPSKYFQATAYTGAGGNQAITNDGFSDLQPDLVWVKKRSATDNHELTDSSRGTTKYLGSSTDAAEATRSNGVQSFDSNGFTAGGSGSWNESGGYTYASWQWKMNGGTTTTNNDGNRSVTLQANATAGQSIMLYEGSGADGATYGHGLGAKPHMVIMKDRDSSNRDWIVWHHRIANERVSLNSTSAAGGGGNGEFQTFTSSVIALESWSQINAAESFLAYAFTSIEGYSKFDIFEGNDPSNYETDDNGTFVYCGFKPAFVMYKAVDNSSNWLMFDNKRNKDATDNWNGNTIWERLYTNSSSQQSSATENFIDFLSNGFQIKINDGNFCDSWNEDGELYVFAAFAEQPFITSSGVPCTAV